MTDIANPDTGQLVALPRVYRGNDLRIVSVTGGKGGVGKSSIAVNLAIGLSSLGGRVLILDGDLGLANADQLLGVHASATLWDVIQGRITLEEAVLKTPWQVSLLPACSGRKEMVALSEAARSNLITGVRALSDQYDYVIIDTAAGIGEIALNLTAAASIVLAVVTPDPTSVRDVFSVMKLLSKEHGIEKIALLANKVVNREQGLDLFRRLSSVTGRFLPLSLSFAGVVVRDQCLARSIVDRRPLMAAYPGCMAAKQIHQLASHLVTTYRNQAAAEPSVMSERGTS